MAAALLAAGLPAFAEGGPKPSSSMSNPYIMLLVIVAVALALVIAILAKVVLGAAGIFVEKAKQEGKQAGAAATKAAVVAGLVLFGGIKAMAQDAAADAGAAATASSSSVSSVSDTAYYLLVSVVFTELLLILVLLYMLRVFIGIKRKAGKLAAGAEGVAAVKAAKAARLSWWDKFNKFKTLQEEVELDLGHNYDGIRELDNRLPPWWLWGFYITIIFACGYLYMHHISHTLPDNLQQYQAQVAEGEAQKEAYLKKAANNVDENTVKLLTDQASVDAGKAVFQSTCFACHGKAGEGGVGPNLTDNYWLHGGSISDVFKTIKYGWPDKGMKSWKDDFSPVQIAQIASYVKSLHGTNPANAKAPQGTLFTDSSITAAKDTTLVTKKM